LGAKALGLGLERDLDALVDAQGVFLDLILKQQINDIAKGIPPSNRVEVRGLSRRDRDQLGLALKTVEHLQDIAQELLFKG
jgi:DNA polymerase-3 subunit epsilon/CBS domain-containing protein